MAKHLDKVHGIKTKKEREALFARFNEYVDATAGLEVPVPPVPQPTKRIPPKYYHKVCLFCSKTVKRLDSHLRNIHQVTGLQLKQALEKVSVEVYVIVDCSIIIIIMMMIMIIMIMMMMIIT